MYDTENELNAPFSRNVKQFANRMRNPNTPKGSLSRDANVYHTAKLSFGGDQSLLKSGNSRRIGVSTFTDNKLDRSQVLKVFAIALMWGAALDTATTSANIHFGNNNKSIDAPGGTTRTIPAMLLNADLEVTRNSEVVISRPVSDFIVPGDVTTSHDPRIGIAQLLDHKVFDDTSNIGIVIRFPEDGTAPDVSATSYWIKVKLYGEEINPANA